MSDLAGPAIDAAPDLAVSVDAAANAGRERHVEERRVSLAGAECRFGQRTRVSIVVHHGGHSQLPREELREAKIVPAANVRRKGHALLAKIHRPPEPDATTFKRRFDLPLPGDRDDLPEHPIACAFAIRRARFAFDHALALEKRDRELGPSDIHRQRIHARAASSTSAGEAVPVPFFMIVMDAARLPNRAASTGDRVTASTMAAAAEKLSPAPQMSTGCSMGVTGTLISSPGSTTSAPPGPSVTIINFERQHSSKA